MTEFNPSMPLDVCEYFKEKLMISNKYLEFGSGGSTVLASKYIKGSIISIESDKEWYEKLKQYLGNNDKVHLHLVDLYCKPNTWGHPTAECPIENKRLYSNIVKSLNIEDVDLVLIDGRFRAACALQIHSLISENTVVLFDDFNDRIEHYGIVLDYYDIVHSVGRMLHLQKKKYVSVDKDIISKYELQAI